MRDLDFLIQRSILKTGNRLLNIRSDNLKAFDLTPNQSETLLFFDRHPGAIILDLKDYLQISHQAARNLVERMKEKDLLQAVVSDTDGRAKQIYLSSKGTAICNQLKQQGGRVGSELLRVLSETEQENLLHPLEKISSGPLNQR